MGGSHQKAPGCAGGLLLLIYAKIAPHFSPETTQPLPTLADGERTTQPLPTPAEGDSYRYVGKDQSIVEDTRTKLQWQRCSLGQTWNGATCTGKAVSYKWDEAQRVAPEGWRLPTKGELSSLVYCSSGKPAYWGTTSEKCKGDFESPTIWRAAFPNTPQAWFWSSSTNTSNSYSRWYVNFYDGNVDNDNKSYVGYVRLVRDGITQPDRAPPTLVAPTTASLPAKAPEAPQPPAAPGAKAPLYYAADLPPTANIPPEAPLCYKFMVAGPEEQLQKLKTKYPGLYEDKIATNPEGGKNLVAKRRDETGKEITYFYSTNPGVCNTYQKGRLQTPAQPGDREETTAASPPGAAPASAGSDNSPNARYRFLGKDQGIVEDTRTKLQWQRCSLGQTWTGATCAGEAKEYDWGKAQRVAPTGWRLPTKDELTSLVYCSSGEPAYWQPASGECKGAYGSPAIWSVAFPNTPATMEEGTPYSTFWSSSPYPGDSDSAWAVDFNHSDVNYYPKSIRYYMRLVRGGH